MSSAPAMPAWLRAELPFRSSLLPVDGRVMHVMEAGDPAGEPVLLLHGNPTWGYLWRWVACAAVLAGRRVLMPDLMGCGFSERVAADEHTLENHTRWTGALLAALGVERPVLVGQDWGGPIGVLALGAHRAATGHAPRGVLLLNTLPQAPREGFRPHPFHQLSRVPLLGSLLYRGAGLPLLVMPLAQADRASLSRRARRAYRFALRGRNASPLGLARMVPNDLEHPSVPWLRRCEEILSDLDAPLHFLWGVKDPMLGRVIRRLEARYPKARARKEEAGHYLQEEIPGAIAEEIDLLCRRAYA